MKEPQPWGAYAAFAMFIAIIILINLTCAGNG